MQQKQITSKQERERERERKRDMNTKVVLLPNSRREEKELCSFHQAFVINTSSSPS